jgi:N-carbamoyl-L-amino-acid hydrolase
MSETGARFDEMMGGLSQIGLASAGGYDRFAWTPADAELRSWFAAEAECRAMPLETDRNGNLWAWWPAPAPGAVGTGSHLDSVPAGGAYDGPLGVVSAFLAVDELRDHQRAGAIELRRPLAVACFADEEGARFGVACIGSRLATGALDPARARGLRDRDGVSLAEAMAAAGLDPAGIGPDPDRIGALGCFVELHVEQGRALAPLGAAVGVASGIWPHGRWRCRAEGEPNHAGTTRLEDRRDPVLVLARLVSEARRAAARHGALATVGRLSAEPGATNAVAALVEAWLDARAPDEDCLERLVADVEGAALAEGSAQGVACSLEAESRSPAVVFDPRLRARAGAAVARALGAAPEIPTGAGHDAGILAALLPAAMLFVRNPSGSSHTPAEHAERDDCLAGVEALAAVLADLAAEP